MSARRAVELWKPVDVKGFEHAYEVSSRGRVRSVARTVTDTRGRVRRFPGRVLRQAHTRGVAHVTLSVSGVGRRTYRPPSACGGWW